MYTYKNEKFRIKYIFFKLILCYNYEQNNNFKY